MAPTEVDDHQSAVQWTYLHPIRGVDPADAQPDFHTQFYQVEFNDKAWLKTPPEFDPAHGFSYGQPNEQQSAKQPLDMGVPENPQHRMSAYIRVRFVLQEAHDDLVFHCHRDDGLIIYLDGKEVARDNVHDGDEAFDLFAAQTVSGDDEKKIHGYPLQVAVSPGDHVLAISLHNRGGGSSDLSIGAISLEKKARKSETDSQTKR